MKSYQARAERILLEGEARLVLRSGNVEPPLAGPGKGSLVDVSRSGAAVVIAPIRFGKLHLVYSPQADASQMLYLEVGKVISLPIRPVWFHRQEKNGIAAYRVGVAFVTPPNEKQWGQLLARKARRRSWLWGRLFAKRSSGAGLGGRR